MLIKSLALTTALLMFSSVSSAAVLDGEDSLNSVSMSAGKFKDWSSSFFSVASVSNMRPGKSTKEPRSVDTYDYLSLNYRIDSSVMASLRLPFVFNSAGVDEYGDKVTSNFAMHDIHFVYSNFDLGYIGDVDLAGKAKVYLPTGQASQARKTISRLRLEGYADYVFARSWMIAYVAKPDIYWQSQTATLDSTMPQFEDTGIYKSDPRRTTQQFGLEHYIQLQWDINPMFSLSTKTGFDEGWYHSSAVEELEGDHTTSFRLGLNLWIRPVRGLSFSLGISNDTRLNSFNGKDIAFVEPFNTQYSLMTNAYLF